MFMGTSYNSIDEKNRMIVPSKLRAGLGTRCILTKGLDRCLYIYTTEDWDKQMNKISQLPESDPKVRAFIRHFCANAAECEFDKQGRILVPASLRKYADLQKDVVLTGMDTRIELWSAEKWDVENDMDDEDMEAVAAHMASLGVNI